MLGCIFRDIGEKGFKFYFFLFIAIIYLPLVLLVIFSFNNSILMGFPWRGFTLKWWEQFLHNPTALGVVKNSFIVASVAAVVSTASGLLAAFVLVRHIFRGKNLITYSIVLPMLFPAIVVGISILIFLRSVLNINLSLFTIMIGHILFALPYVTLILMARLIGFDRSLEEAAYDLGADEFTTFRKITLPLIMPGIFVALFIAFTISLEDVVIAHFLAGAQSTIPVFVYGQLRRWSGLPMVMAISAFMIMIMAVLLIISLISARRGY